MWKRTVCTKDCPDTCGLLAEVKDGCITAVKGDPDHPYTRGFICKKGATFPEHVHSKKRITTPLKRIGRKGSGEFQPITWDEALNTVASQFTSVSEKYGPEAILPYSYAGHMGLIHRNAGHALFNKLGASVLGYTICSASATAGFKASLGSGPSTDIQEAAKSDFIIIWGSNTKTTNVHAWPHFLAARKKGATLVVIDPYRNRTAQDADLHIKLRPGTDAALALSMMHILIAEEMVDMDFIKSQTIGYEELTLRAAEYSPARVAEICGIDEKLIWTLARGYGQATAPYIRTGWGPARQLKGGMAMRTIALLPALVNAFSKPGGGITRSLGGAPNDITSLTRPDLRPPNTRTVNMVELGNALTTLDDPGIHMLYVYLSNPAVVAPQSRMVLEGMAREDLFIVVQEMYMTDTARYADIILPGASFFEVTDIYTSYGHNYIQRAEPVIPQIGECRSTLAIFQGLAQRLGFTEEVFHMTEEDFIKRFLQDNTSPYLNDVDVTPFHVGLPIRLNIPANPYAGGFNTPSGKVEFYSESLKEQGLDPLPDGEPLRDPDGGSTYPLEFLTPPHHLMLNSAFNEITGLTEAQGMPTVKIHPMTAHSHNITQGDLTRVYNARGECQLYAEITEDVREEVLVAEGLHWPSLSPGGGANQLTSQRLTDMGGTCAFHCNRVAIERITE